MKQFKLSYLWLKLSYKFRFAHHPVCAQYSSQYFKIGSMYICQGCTLVTFGLFGGFGVGLIVATLIPHFFLSAMLLAELFLLPTVLADSIYLGRNWKRLGRIGIGLGASVAVVEIIIQPWFFKVLAIVLLYGNYQLYRVFRQQKPSVNLCPTCEFYEDKPHCPGIEPKLVANREYMQQANLLLAKDFEKIFEQIKQSQESLTEEY